MRWPPRAGNFSDTWVHTCHYCERIDGLQTGDHKLPLKFGGTRGKHRLVLPDVQLIQGQPTP